MFPRGSISQFDRLPRAAIVFISFACKQQAVISSSVALTLLKRGLRRRECPVRLFGDGCMCGIEYGFCTFGGVHDLKRPIRFFARLSFGFRARL
jgi:hypothetical protein